MLNSENLCLDSFNNALTQLSDKLLKSKNIIIKGAPGTGKTYLSKELAAHIVTKGQKSYSSLSSSEMDHIDFVQFSPNYDYSDFIEGLSPIKSKNGSMQFELKCGSFKKFIYLSQRINDELSHLLEEYLMHENFSLGDESFKVKKIDDANIYCYKGNQRKLITIPIRDFKNSFCSNMSFTSVTTLRKFLNRADTAVSCLFQIVNNLNNIDKNNCNNKVKELLKKLDELRNEKYVFIIDEINRGNISKIFGEIFFSIDPGYRGPAGAVLTQYANLNKNRKLFIPEYMYIIGTLNTIDHTVETLDFAIRRRFRFIEIKTDLDDPITNHILNLIDESKRETARKQMSCLNNAIIRIPTLNRNHQIGASYFLKLNKITPEELWNDYLLPIIEQYTQGITNKNHVIFQLHNAFLEPLK